MRRQVSAQLQLDVTEPALLALQITAATRPEQEQLTIDCGGALIPYRELTAPHGGRLQVIDAPIGNIVIDYAATVDGEVPTPEGDEHDRLAYLRPSRYCPSDKLLATAAAEFGHLKDTGEIVTAVARWVGVRLAYIVGSSGPTDDAVDTLLLGEGVCRDYAHLVVGLLRAQDIPARLAAVYAPGLAPMDFHAVDPGLDDGAWRVVDATGLAPRRSMLRIATGRDAADTAFLSVHHGTADLTTIGVLAIVDALPNDDPAEVVALT
jgi:transglutaminase-like putative cysteine protease